MRTTRLAMIGCGRAAESLHLPAAALGSGVETTVLVDKDLERARKVAQAYGVKEVRDEATDAAGLADAAVVALPHHLHAPVTRNLLSAGLHVLVEKPLALTSNECFELSQLAKERGLVLAVGMVRRSFPALRFVKQALERRLLGDLERVTLREGMPFSWEVASDFTFRRETGGGVLADTGVHVLDLLAWWFGDLEVTGYRDDAHGGVEAECEIDLTLPDGTPVTVELSRTRLLDNSVTIEGSRGKLVAGTGFDAPVRLDLGGPVVDGAAHPAGRSYHNVRELFIEQVEDFARAIRERGTPAVTGEEAGVGVSLLESCRELRQPLQLPWATVPAGVAA